MLAWVFMSGTATVPAFSRAYGLGPTLRGGGLVAQAVFGILMLMSINTIFVLFTKLLDQQRIIAQARQARQGLWFAGSLRDGTVGLDLDSPYKRLLDDGVAARDQHALLTVPVEVERWMRSTLARSQSAINARLGDGLARLATVGATAPFIGLFGTVIGIDRALIRIGETHQPSIAAVAGPVGEALIMTALGLVVAVPAVVAYNWLQRRNRSIADDLSAFSADLFGTLASRGALRPSWSQGAPWRGE